MKNMRKQVAAGVAALMIAGSLAGCGGSNEELEALQAENAQLKASLEELNTSMAALSASLESVESNAAASVAGVETELMAQSLLIAAQNAYIDFDREKLEAAMAAVEPYVGYLEGADMNAYYMILEYMEQPYNGTDTEMP